MKKLKKLFVMFLMLFIILISTQIYAETEKIIITYNYNPQSLEKLNFENEVYEYDKEVTIYHIDNPVNKYYSFKGWYRSSNFQSDTLLKRNDKISTSTTFYAKWEATNHFIVYHLNDGVNNESNPIYFHSNETLSLNNPTKEGYTFLGWYKDSNFSEENKFINKSKWNTTMNLYAKWGENYTITYNLNGGTNNESNPETYTTESDDITLLEATKVGYTFDGWYNGETKVETITKGSTGDITLEARFTPITYNITYNLNGGTNNESNPETYTTESDDITLLEATKVGYTFDGWYNEETKVETITKGSTGDITLEARFTPITYNITYILNGGTIDGNNPTSYTTESDDITLLEATKVGYTFDGWYNGETKVETITKGSTGDITLEARFTPITYNITYILNGGTIDGNNPTSYSIESDDITLISATKEGYLFDGWYNEETKVETITKGSTGDITLEARYFEAVTVTFKIENNEIISFEDDSFEKTYTIKKNEKIDEITKLKILDKRYKFDYWRIKNEDGSESKFDFNTAIESNITLYSTINERNITVTFNAGDGYILNRYNQKEKTITVTYSLNDFIDKNGQIDLLKANDSGDYSYLFQDCDGNFNDNKFIKEGYFISYWYTTDENVPMTDLKISDDINLNIKWEKGAKYTIIAGEGNSLYNGLTGEYITDLTLYFRKGNPFLESDGKNKLTRTYYYIKNQYGYKFLYWYQNDENIEYDNKENQDDDKIVQDDTTLYAKYDIPTGENAIQVTYKLLDKNLVRFKNNTSLTEVTIFYYKNNSLDYKEPILELKLSEGYEFLYWSLSQDGKEYLNDGLTENLVLYAIVDTKTYYVEYVLYNDETVNDETDLTDIVFKEEFKNSDEIYTLPILKDRESSLFKGWKDSSDNTITNLNPATFTAKNMKVYAIWEIRIHTVKFYYPKESNTDYTFPEDDLLVTTTLEHSKTLEKFLSNYSYTWLKYYQDNILSDFDINTPINEDMNIFGDIIYKPKSLEDVMNEVWNDETVQKNYNSYAGGLFWQKEQIVVANNKVDDTNYEIMFSAMYTEYSLMDVLGINLEDWSFPEELNNFRNMINAIRKSSATHFIINKGGTQHSFVANENLKLDTLYTTQDETIGSAEFSLELKIIGLVYTYATKVFGLDSNSDLDKYTLNDINGMTVPVTLYIDDREIGNIKFKFVNYPINAISQKAAKRNTLISNKMSQNNEEVNTNEEIETEENVAYVNGNYYTTLEEALNETTNGIVVLLKDYVLTNSITIKEGVNLVIPHEDNVFNPYEFTDDNWGTSKNNVEILYRTLTLSSNVVLTVKGNLTVNATTGMDKDNTTSGTRHHGINGNYSQIILDQNSKIVVEGELNVFGKVSGEGEINVTTGELSENYVIRNWRGGSKAAGAYHYQDIYPMLEFDMPYITSTINLTSDSKYYGYVKMATTAVLFFPAENHYTKFEQIGETGFIKLKDEATAIINKTVVNNNYVSSDIVLNGGAIEQGGSLEIADLTAETYNVFFPISWGRNITLENGIYELYHKMKFLPGSNLTVEQNATLKLNDNAELVLYEEFNDQATFRPYPIKNEVNFNLKGILELSLTSKFAGVITSNTINATIKNATSSNFLEMTVKEFKDASTLGFNSSTFSINQKTSLKTTSTYKWQYTLNQLDYYDYTNILDNLNETPKTFILKNNY